MTSFILQVSTRYLKTLLILFSFYILMRGHNAPGGGFVGGLLAASAYVLYALAFGVEAGKKSLWFELETFVSLGLLAALSSALVGVFSGHNFMTSQWVTFHHIPIIHELALGTPVLFDIGVYLVVFGVILMIIYSLIEE